MLCEIHWLIKKEGKILWLPILWGLLYLIEILWIFNFSMEVDSIPYHLGNNVPVFAFFWPLFAMHEVVSSNGGELYLVYRRKVTYWLRYIGCLILAYTLLAIGIAYIWIRLMNFEGWGLILRIASISIVYGWLGFCLITWTRDVIWSTFISLTIFIALHYGKILDSVWWNLHKFPLEGQPRELVVKAVILSVGLVALGSLGLVRRRVTY